MYVHTFRVCKKIELMWLNFKTLKIPKVPRHVAKLLYTIKSKENCKALVSKWSSHTEYRHTVQCTACRTILNHFWPENMVTLSRGFVACPALIISKWQYTFVLLLSSNLHTVPLESKLCTKLCQLPVLLLLN